MNHLVEFFEMTIDPELISFSIISVDFSHIVIDKQAIQNHEMQFHFQIGFFIAQILHWPLSVLFLPPKMKIINLILSVRLIIQNSGSKGNSISRKALSSKFSRSS
jgi:hypothetical protein